ncbi:CBS domain-containing protein [Halalkalirubrum salinum]|uniref:CBS domain-containing protein n=1 Tax=Halalkalirubrum salinum TaxID=2563889 RepID=UPI0010FB14F8|nr:CBS domain-containing protein [Halalkalirubrum salinum]
MLVQEAMSTGLVTVPLAASVREAVKRMLHAGVGSVVVTHEDDPVGILTETDALIAGYRTARSFDEIPVKPAMSRPLQTIAPRATVRAAVDRMHREEIKKLAVVEGLNLVGIITATDIATKHDALVAEALALDRDRTRWEDDKSDASDS